MGIQGTQLRGLPKISAAMKAVVPVSQPPFHFRCVVMSIERAEQLKADLSSKWVIVDPKIPELRRFSGLTGKVQTVNMNCRALVQFQDTPDIAWYDIEPTFLRVVEAPAPKAKEEHAPKAAKAAPAAPAPAADGGGGKKLSPLELARQQGAAKAGGAPAAAPEAGKKLSPLELARQQGAGKATAAAPAAAPAGDAGKKLSPLEMARLQGAGGKKPAAVAAEEAPAVAPAPAAEKKPVPTTGADGKKLSPLELARLQGAPKR